MAERSHWFRSAPAGFAAGIVVIIAPVLATTSLDDVRCDHENPRVESYYSLGHDYLPRIERIHVRGPEGESSLEGKSPTCFEREGLKLCFRTEYDEITLEALNESASVATADWSRGAYVDENGARRKLDSDSFSSDRYTMIFPDRDARIPIGARTFEKAWPEGKRYYAISGCKDAYAFQEPLVPARLTGAEESDRAIVDRVAKQRVPVVFEVPVRHGSAELHFRIEILILPQREAWARGFAEAEQERALESSEAGGSE